MADFMVHFFISNLMISGMIAIILAARRLFRNILSARMQYHLWFLLPGLLSIPFLPFRPIGFPQIISWLDSCRSSPVFHKGAVVDDAFEKILTGNTDWMNDFALSVNNRTPFLAGILFFGIWVMGMIIMTLFVIQSSLLLHTLAKSALPLQNPEVCRLYHCCLNEMKIRDNIPICSTAYLSSPVIAGFLKPRIYLPIRLISDYHESEMRYMLLHELQHYKHRDHLAGQLMNLTSIVYWFHPLIWYALKEMRSDREIACDASVLQMLEKEEYLDYGNTLISFAEKVSFFSFPFAAGLGGNMKQMKRRILYIASYKTPAFSGKIKGIIVFLLTSVLLFGLSPFLSTYAEEVSHYQWKPSSGHISCPDLSAYFAGYDGCFVFYDSESDSWMVYNMDRAVLRVSPDSTYKIYDALFGLENDIIAPEDSLIPWNGDSYPFKAWNADQTLSSAMSASVNWYFQSIDHQIGTAELSRFLQKIEYGNKRISGALSSYWMESSLKISPVEQVELLTKLQDNSFDFSPENIQAVKQSLCLSTSDTGTLYGKTGTGRIGEKDVNGWFVGFVEQTDQRYYFAANISADADAVGSRAAEITMSILSDMNIWKPS